MNTMEDGVSLQSKFYLFLLFITKQNLDFFLFIRYPNGTYA